MAFFLSFIFLCLWLGDILFQDKFFQKETLWKSHPLCFITFTVILWHTMVNAVLLTYLSMTRLRVVIQPMYAKSKNMNSSFYYSCFGLIFFSCLSSIFAFLFSGAQINTDLCVPFVDPTGSVTLVTITKWFVICLQSITPVATTVIHCIIYRQVKKSKKAVGISKSKDESIKGLICQLVIQDVSNFLCCYPASVIYLLCMFLVAYPANLVAWSIVLVLPINPIMIPVIFIVSAVKKKFKSKEKPNMSNL